MERVEVMKYEQLDLFSEVTTSTEQRMLFFGLLYDENWKVKTHTVNGTKDIVIDASKKLSKNELKELCRKSVKVVRGTYGFEVFYIENEINKRLFVRFVNETTKAKNDVFQHIDLYFDDYVEF